MRADRSHRRAHGDGGRRPKGSPDKIPQEIVAWRQDLLASEEYKASAKIRVLAGEANHIETYMLHRICGKPKETVAVEGQGMLTTVFLGALRDPLADPEELKASGPGNPPLAN